MAKKETKRPAGSRRTGSSGKSVSKPARASSRGGGAGSGTGKRTIGKRSQAGSDKSAADALLGLLESPLVADILAAGAAAALAVVAQRGLSRRSDDGTKATLKNAAKAAAAAMGARISEEVEEIVRSSSEAKREEA